MALRAKEIPKDRREIGKLKILNAELRGTLAYSRIGAAGPSDTGEIAFDIRHEHGHASAAKLLGNHAQRNRLAGPGRARNQPMAIRHAQQYTARLFPLSDQYVHGHLRNLLHFSHL
jgi:hypothetical protein